MVSRVEGTFYVWHLKKKITKLKKRIKRLEFEMGKKDILFFEARGLEWGCKPIPPAGMP